MTSANTRLHGSSNPAHQRAAVACPSWPEVPLYPEVFGGRPIFSRHQQLHRQLLPALRSRRRCVCALH